MKINLKIIIALLIVSINSLKSQDIQVIDGIIAVVGNNAILQSDVDKGIMQYKVQGVAIEESTDCVIFESLMIEKLLVHNAIADSLEISDSEVEQNVESRLQQLVMKVGSIKEVEKIYNKTEEDIRDEIFDILKDQMLAQMMQQQIVANVDITPDEVRTFFDEIPENELPDFSEEVILAKITKNIILGQDTKDIVINQLNEIRTDILENGASFKTKAVLYSEDPGSAAKGGAYNGVRKGQFVKPFEEIAFNLKENEISEPFETQFGFHIIQLIKRKGEELDLRHILIKPQPKEEDLEETKAVINTIKDKILNEEITFQESTLEHSDDEHTKNNNGLMINPISRDNNFKLSELPQEIYFAVGSLNEGDISKVVSNTKEDGTQEFMIIKLIKRTPAHKADFSLDYQKIKQMALNKKKAETSNDWIKNHIDGAYIRIVDDYKDCKFDNNWKI